MPLTSLNFSQILLNSRFKFLPGCQLVSATTVDMTRLQPASKIWSAESEKYFREIQEIHLSFCYVACLPPQQPLLWQVRPAASNCCPTSHNSQPHMCPNTQIYMHAQIQILFSNKIHVSKSLEIQINCRQLIMYQLMMPSSAAQATVTNSQHIRCIRGKIHKSTPLQNTKSHDFKKGFQSESENQSIDSLALLAQ